MGNYYLNQTFDLYLKIQLLYVLVFKHLKVAIEIHSPRDEHTALKTLMEQSSMYYTKSIPCLWGRLKKVFDSNFS